jgi:predicted enzyme related to lactoylglutathione lyase
MSKVAHFEINADEPERAMNFYKEVFGWKFQRWGDQEYWLAMTGEKAEPGIDGAIMPRTDPTAKVVNTINVRSIDDTITSIMENGGNVVVPKMEVPKIGWLIYFLDTEGNMFGAMEMFSDAMMVDRP